MSRYQLQKAIYTYLKLPEAERRVLDGPALRQQFDLTDAEAEAFVQTDIVALTRLGVHPVLLNSYVRGRHIPREVYRAALEATARRD